MEFSVFKIETFIPEEYVEELRKNLNHIGALTIGGSYDNCMSVSKVIGSWRPLNGAQPLRGKWERYVKQKNARLSSAVTRKS